MAQFTLWLPWMATSQTPWFRSYTPSLATISTYHQPPLSFTYHTLLHNPVHTKELTVLLLEIKTNLIEENNQYEFRRKGKNEKE